MKDYYKILGVDKKSTQDDIKKAYRKLSKKYHPDINNGDDTKFKQISEAYETLGDVGKRKKYDSPNTQNNPFNYGGNPFSDFMNGFRRQQKRNRPNKVIKVDITPIESYRGGSKNITFKNKHKCDLCAGTGGKKNTCQTCGGSGTTIRKVGTGFFTHVTQTQCNECLGTGKIVIEPCVSCFGVGSKEKFESINVNIPKSVSDNENLRLVEKGDYYGDIGYGDVILNIRIIESDGFEKIGNDLIYTKNLNLLELLNMDEMIIPHPDGDINIKIPESFQTNKPLRIKGKGYISNNNGDFYIKINMIYKKLNIEDKKDIIEKLKT